MVSKKQPLTWEQSEDEESSSSSSSSKEREGGVQDEVEVIEAEAPKFAQYIDSEEEEEESEEEQYSTEEDDSEEGEKFPEEMLRKKMEKVPFSALARAQKLMTDGRGREEGNDSEEDEFEVERIEERKKLERKRNGWQDLQKRENKHAPAEMSSRKPVSRKRAVVESQGNVTRRDPRFSSLSASIPNVDLFNSSYGFLREKQSSEVSELKNVFNKLKRQEANHAGPKAKSELAQSIQRERQEVEMALKRAEGRENERRKRERERQVIQREKKAIQDRVKQGGKQFYLKESVKKQLILKDKFERLSGSREENDDGTSRKDLKRAIERRRKKNAAKERREMPLGGGSSSRPDPNSVPKRKRLAYSSSSNGNTNKRGRRD